jgi:hypothetical protein
MPYEARIILDSVGPNGARLTTFELSYPRFVHAELLTHRTFSRNSASSRAIPVEKLLGRIEDDPVIPVFWGSNRAGMQAREELSDFDKCCAETLWRAAVRSGVDFARKLGAMGLHKQIANRAAELGMFITVVVTATEWSNFFALRDHPDAQPELRSIAAKAHALYREYSPQELAAGAWHLPYVTGYDDVPGYDAAEALAAMDARQACLIAVGRCAAVSYLNQGQRDIKADAARAEKNLVAGHMSPFEHVAQAMTTEEWRDYGYAAAIEWVTGRVPPGNLWGWRQFRKTINNEHDFRLVMGG